MDKWGILFRGFNPEAGSQIIMTKAGTVVQGKWVYGVPIFTNSEAAYIREVQPDGTMENRLVLSETIGQFTGAVDMNGSRIFEGDLIEVESGVKKSFEVCDGPVFFGRGCFRLSWSLLGTFDALIDCDGKYLRGTVVGSIFDVEGGAAI